MSKYFGQFCTGAVLTTAVIAAGSGLASADSPSDAITASKDVKEAKKIVLNVFGMT